MIKKFLLFFIALNFYFSQSIIHSIIETTNQSSSIQFDVMLDEQGKTPVRVTLMYKTVQQFSYQELILPELSSNTYQGILPGNFVTGTDIEYFIIAEFTDQSMISFPKDTPFENPFLIKVQPIESMTTDFTPDVEMKKKYSPQMLILSPQPGEKVENEDILIAVSYFQMKHIDVNSIQIKLNDRNITSKAEISSSYLSIPIKKLSGGFYQISVSAKSKYGIEYTPITWNFRVIELDKESRDWMSYIAEQHGRAWTTYSLSELEDQSIEVNNVNMNYFVDLRWLKGNSNLMLTSLESPYQQPRNRYSLHIYNRSLDLKLGDFFPNINPHGFNRYRVRGVGADFHNKWLGFHVVQGELAREVHGDPSNNAFIVSRIIDPTESTKGIIEISRNNYTFKQDVIAANLSLKIPDRMHWNINFTKAKDNSNSVNKSVENARIVASNSLINTDSEFTTYYSDEETTSTCTLPNSITLLDSIYTVDDCETECTELGGACDVTITEGSHSFLIEDLNSNESEILDSEYTYELIPRVDWTGAKPQDNIVVGTDIRFFFNKKRTSIRGGLTFSMLNQNIFDPVMQKSDFDIIMDNIEDCYVGQSYVDIGVEIIWFECQSYIDIGEVGVFEPGIDLPINLNVDVSGISLDEIPIDPIDYQDFFHININQVPLLPIDITSGEIGLHELMNLPSMVYDFGAQFNYWNHFIQYEFIRVGPEFHSLANPYIQTNSQRQTWSDRMRFMNNKLFLNFKFIRQKDGLNLEDDEITHTNSINMNIGLFPGANMPVVNVNFMTEHRFNNSEFIDTLDYNTSKDIQTNSFNISITDRFKYQFPHRVSLNMFISKKDDNMQSEYLDSGDTTYYSPVSFTMFASLNLHSTLSPEWESTVNFSRNNFSSGLESSEYYQFQTFYSTNMALIYHGFPIVKTIRVGLNFMKGEGSDNSFVYSTLKLSGIHDLFSNFQLSWNYDFQHKSIRNIADSLKDEYNNSILKAKLVYSL